ncbi:MAG: hypothetical protein LBG28_04270 [Tannerella sp.]|nr:hypothetical protein [Tannerella sp.]
MNSLYCDRIDDGESKASDEWPATGIGIGVERPNCGLYGKTKRRIQL